MIRFSEQFYTFNGLAWLYVLSVLILISVYKSHLRKLRTETKWNWMEYARKKNGIANLFGLMRNECHLQLERLHAFFLFDLFSLEFARSFAMLHFVRGSYFNMRKAFEQCGKRNEKPSLGNWKTVCTAPLKLCSVLPHSRCLRLPFFLQNMSGDSTHFCSANWEKKRPSIERKK